MTTIKGQLIPIEDYWLVGLCFKIFDDEIIPDHILKMATSLPKNASLKEEYYTQRNEIFGLMIPILKQHGYDVFFEKNAIWINVPERDFIFEKLKGPVNYFNKVDKIRK
jgi:hypothetical protein